jgi:hypothetical protein
MRVCAPAVAAFVAHVCAEVSTFGATICIQYVQSVAWHHAHASIYLRACTFLQADMHVYPKAYSRATVHIHTQIHTYIHTHIHTHAHAHTSRAPSLPHRSDSLQVRDGSQPSRTVAFADAVQPHQRPNATATPDGLLGLLGSPMGAVLSNQRAHGADMPKSVNLRTHTSLDSAYEAPDRRHASSSRSRHQGNGDDDDDGYGASSRPSSSASNGSFNGSGIRQSLPSTSSSGHALDTGVAKAYYDRDGSTGHSLAGKMAQLRTSENDDGDENDYASATSRSARPRPRKAHAPSLCLLVCT